MKNTFVKVLSFLMALTMIVGMFGAMTISASAHTHTKGEQVGEPVPATCASIGYTFYKCATCGETYPDDVVPMSKEHTGVVDVEASEATCTYPAMTAGKYCEDCDSWVKGYEIAPVEGSNPVGHKFVGAHMGTYCQMIEYYVCSVCNLSYEDAKEADAKDYFLSGYDENGDGDYEDKKDVEGLKQIYPDIDWYTYDDKFAASIVRAQAHVWEYEVVKASTKCEDGAIKRTCETCGLAEEMVLRAPHDGFTVAYKGCEEYTGTKCGICGTPNPDDVAVNRTPNNHAWGLVTTFNTELQKLGYTAATITKDATCTEAGYVLIYCSNCKTYAENPVSALGHSWDANAKKDPNKSSACMPGYTLLRVCNRPGCDAEEVLNTVADRGHVWTEKVTEPTCTTEGYTTRKCLNPNCDEVETYNYTEALGHVWGEYEVEQGGYGNHAVDFIKSRSCVVCETVDEDNKITVVEATEDGECVFDSAISLSKATCTTPAFYIRACTVEGCTKYIQVDANGNEVSDANRVYSGDVSTSNHDTDPENLRPKQAAVAPTCNKEGSQLMFCKNCQVNVTVTTEKLAHKFVYGGIYDDKNDGNLSTAADKDFTQKPATCTKAGSTAGTLCVLCGATKVAPKSTPIDPNNHVDKNGKEVKGEEFETTPANCQNGGTTKTYYSCCDKTYTTLDRDDNGDLLPTDTDKHVNFTVYEAVAAKCDVDGNHLYYICDDCGALEIVYTITKGKRTYTCNCGDVDHAKVTDTTPYVIPATGHTGTLTPQAGLPETCTEFGYTAHYKYVGDGACGCTIGKNAIAPHGDTYVGKIYETEVTCTDYGFNIFSNDTATEEVYDSKVYVKDCLECFNKYGVEYDIIVPQGHTYTETTIADANDCTAPSFVVKECACGDVYTKGYVAPKYTEHRYDVIKFAFTVKNERFQYNGQWAQVTVDANGILTLVQTVSEAKDATPACLYPSYTYQKCVNGSCKKVMIVEGTENAPVAHYSKETGEKVEITWSCTGFEASLNMTCELCGQKVVAGSMTHKAEYISKEPTCTENGYFMYVCVDCGSYLDADGNIANDKDDNDDNDSISEVYPAFGHNPYDVDADGKADYIKTTNTLANAIYDVNDSVDYVVEAKDATPYADGYITYMCNKCQEVVTVVIPARNSLKFNATTDDLIVNNGTFTVDVAVTANDFSFNSFNVYFAYDYTAVKFEGATLVFEGFEAADSVTLVSKDNFGYANISVYVPNGANGLAKNATISGDNVAFMTLTFSVLPTANVWFDYNDDKALVIYEADVYDVKVIDEKGKDVAKEYDAAVVELDEEALTLVNLADVNDDNKIDAGDSVAIMTLMYNKEMNTAADINRDGVVDLADHVAVLEFSLSTKSMVEYLEMMGITIEGLVANYNLKFDLDNDKDIDDTDKALLAALLVEELESYDVDYTEMSEFLFFANCEDLAALVDEAARDYAAKGVIVLVDGDVAV